MSSNNSPLRVFMDEMKKNTPEEHKELVWLIMHEALHATFSRIMVDTEKKWNKEKVDD